MLFLLNWGKVAEGRKEGRKERKEGEGREGGGKYAKANWLQILAITS